MFLGNSWSFLELSEALIDFSGSLLEALGNPLLYSSVRGCSWNFLEVSEEV